MSGARVRRDRRVAGLLLTHYALHPGEPLNVAQQPSIAHPVPAPREPHGATEHHPEQHRRARTGTTTRPRLTATFVTLALSAALLSVAECGGSGSDAPTLDGSAWRLTGWTLSPLDPNDFTITAQFADGEISGDSAVNTYSGPYTAGPDDAFAVAAPGWQARSPTCGPRGPISSCSPKQSSPDPSRRGGGAPPGRTATGAPRPSPPAVRYAYDRVGPWQ